MAEISIIIPCHNVDAYVMRCFDSLRAQTIGLEQLQLIFVDDASSDHTWERLQEIEQLAPQSVCIIRLDENLRQGGARNVGLSYATGTHVGYVDSDDWVEPDMYECLYKAIKQADADLSFCRHVRDNGKGSLYLDPALRGTGKENRTLAILSEEQRNDFIVSNLIGCNVWDKLFRKDFLLDHQMVFPEHLAYEDMYFGSLVYLYARRVSIVEQQLYHYYINENSTVLGRNQSYHKDIFPINHLKWDMFRERGFLEKHHRALEFDFLMSYYMAGFKVLALRFDEIPYDDFMKLKSGTLERIPDFINNPYCQTHIPEIYRLLLTLLSQPITPEQLSEVQQAFKTYHSHF